MERDRSPDQGADVSPTDRKTPDAGEMPAPRSETPAPRSEMPSPHGAALDVALPLAREARCLMLVGAPDTGKTSLATLLAREGLNAGRCVAVLDADVGQSEIGPPGTLGLGFPEAGFARLGEVTPKALAFIGSTSPVGFALECAVAARRLADRAFEWGADLLIVDTTGWVRGAGARGLKLAKADLLQPDRILLLQHGRELDGLARGFPADRVLRLPVSPRVVNKTRVVRTLRRESHFRAYFAPARELEFWLPHLRLRGALLGGGKVLTREALARLQPLLSKRLEYGERAPEGFVFVAHGPCDADDVSRLRQRLDAPVHLMDGARWPGVLVGLLDRNGETLALGLLLKAELSALRVRILAPWLNPISVAGLAFGTTRIRPDGRELTPLRRGEI